MMSRGASSFPHCADYSNGSLFVTIDQWDCRNFGLFIIRRVDLQNNLDSIEPQGVFSFSNEDIDNAIFKRDGVEYEIMAGMIEDGYFDSLSGMENFQTFPYQYLFRMNIYQLPIEKGYLRELLRDNDCYVMTAMARKFLMYQDNGTKDVCVPKGFSFDAVTAKIGWEKEGVTIYNAHYNDYGLCSHKMDKLQSDYASIPGAVSDVVQPEEANPQGNIHGLCITAFMFLSIVIILLGMFYIKHKGSQESENSQ